jgi:phosphatidylinositol glycan class S
LVIVHTKGTVLKTNAFLIPQWGGIMIKNLDFETDNVFFNSNDLQPAMQVFASQLRTLLGVIPLQEQKIKSVLPSFEVIVDKDFKGITKWELDRLLRTRSIQNMMDSVSTLQSFTSLLQSLDTIPVKDHISDIVKKSLDSLAEAKKALFDIDYNVASLKAKDAIFYSEKAFFDPTMVSLLYFPAEHLLAIYMPFFIPIMVPLFATTFKEFKYWRSQTNKIKMA